MPTRKRSNYHPVCYIISNGIHRVCVSNQFTAKIIYQLWCQQAIVHQTTQTISVYGLMSPNSWSTWSRKYIIQLMNSMWKERLVVKSVFADGICTHVNANAEFKLYGDDYERNAEYIYSSMPKTVSTALYNCLMYPEILQIILRAPTPLAAEVAMKIAGIHHFDKDTRVTNIKDVWKFLHYEVTR